MVPEEAVQVTAVLVTVPWTVAEKKSVAFTARVAEAGEMITEFTTGLDGGGFDGGGFDVGETPVAERATTVGVSLTLLRSERLPVLVPGESGVKATAKVFAEPAPRVAGNSSPDRLKPLPVTVT